MGVILGSAATGFIGGLWASGAVKEIMRAVTVFLYFMIVLLIVICVSKVKAKRPRQHQGTMQRLFNKTARFVKAKVPNVVSEKPKRRVYRLKNMDVFS